MQNMENENTKNTIFNWYDFKFKIVIQSIIVGAIAGLFVVVYRFLLTKAFKFNQEIYKSISNNNFSMILWIILMIAFAFIVAFVVKWEPMCSGSGIPQTEGILMGHMSMNWWKVLIGKFVGGVVSIIGGLAVGREGPSIQIGAASAEGFSKICKNSKLEEKFLITSGASAGLAAAFNAPLSGAIFALEEVHKSFSTVVLTCALSSAITADLVSKQFFGTKPVFNFSVNSMLPFKYYGYLIILGIILGLLGIVFNKLIVKSLDFHKKITFLKGYGKTIPAFIMALFIGLTIPYALGGGHPLVEKLVEDGFTLKLLFIILIVRFVFTMISYGSGAPGGIFLPLLVIGAFIGAIFGKTLNLIGLLDSGFIINFIILAMAGYLSAIVKAPITSIVLITEMTGSFSHLLSLAIVCIVAYETTEVLKLKPIYEELLERSLKNEGKNFSGSHDKKVLLEVPVLMGSHIDGKLIKDIRWPEKCLIVSIRRGANEIIPKGDTKVYVGDYILALSNEYDEPVINETLFKICQSQ